MKKSELYHLAQIAVLNSPCISPDNKLDVLRILFADEDSAKYWEKAQAEKEAVEE